MIFDINLPVCEKFASSFCNLTIFPGRKSEMMSTCKGRALEEGGMMNSSVARSWYFWSFLLRPVTFLIKSSFWVKVQCQADLGASPGRKFRRGTEIHNETTTKPSKIQKMRKSSKTAKKCRIHKIFDSKYAFSLCWRSKSFKCATPGSSERLDWLVELIGPALKSNTVAGRS